MDIVKKKLRINTDPRGELIVAEYGIDIPFEIKRVYFLKNLKSDLDRGFHAHKKLQQVMYCVSGSLNVLLDDGFTKKNILLKCGETIFIDIFVWRVMSQFSEDCVIAVFASELYSEADYIREYEDFINTVKAK